MYNPEEHLTRRQVKRLLGISENTFWRLLRDKELKSVANYRRWHLFNKSDVMQLKKRRGDRITVAAWKPGMRAYRDGQYVQEVKPTQDSQYYWIFFEEGDLFKVYKNTVLMKE